MALLTKADLYTHMYKEVIEEIVRSTSDSDSKVAEAISTAEEEAQAYLNRYDIATMFTETFESKLLRNKVKDMACWHLVVLANPNINLELFRTIYEDAIKFFEKVMKGLVDPQGWPLRTDNTDSPQDDAGNVYWTSQPKRQNHF